jgi:hypothetical protein
VRDGRLAVHDDLEGVCCAVAAVVLGEADVESVAFGGDGWCVGVGGDRGDSDHQPDRTDADGK